MRIHHLLFVAVPVALLWCAGAVAQTRHFSWTYRCTAMETHVIKVGDQPGHALGVQQFNCSPFQLGTNKSKASVSTLTFDAWGTQGRDSGWNIVTMENGDRVSLHYHGAFTMKDGKPEVEHGMFELPDGTGKLKSITGNAKYTCKPAVDAFDCTATGEYHLK